MSVTRASEPKPVTLLDRKSLEDKEEAILQYKDTKIFCDHLQSVQKR